MDCDGFRKMISRRLDGELGDAELEKLERHLKVCDACRRCLESFGETVSIHKSLIEVSPPPSIVPSVMAAIEEPEPAWWVRGWLKVAVPAAALIVLLGLQVGGFLTETFVPPQQGDEVAVIELEYLDEYPPGSFGDVLVMASEGGGDEER
ncbi:MAG: zf-HC2 domain-containing protein [bacterium]|nr:MAG: zf-HC2 domain-containing protein [bacterium]